MNITERAKEWMDNEVDLYVLPHEHCVDASSIIRDLLAEVERLEKDKAAYVVERAQLRDRIAELMTTADLLTIAHMRGRDIGRQRAARECVGIVTKYPAFMFGAPGQGVQLNLLQEIKAHFRLED